MLLIALVLLGSPARAEPHPWPIDSLAEVTHVHHGPRRAIDSGPAAALTAANTLGLLEPPRVRPVDVLALRMLAEAPLAGPTRLEELQRALEVLGARAAVRPASLGWLRPAVEQGAMVVISGAGPRGPQRFVLVSGFDATRAKPWLVNDPGLRRPWWVSWRDLKRFRGRSADRSVLVVAGPEPVARAPEPPAPASGWWRLVFAGGVMGLGFILGVRAGC